MKMAVTQSQQKIGAATISIIVAVALIGMQLVVGLATNSLAILADAAHSSLDLLGL
jgi:divalent metal cation (Fe/Co/Zn/Cd) transporter